MGFRGLLVQIQSSRPEKLLKWSKENIQTVPESERYFRWADHEDPLRMPTEILLFHFTRMNHIAASCVGCGMCESACLRGIPLTTIFEAVGDGVQKVLGYEPGRSLEEEIPTAAFKETEA